MKRRKSVEEDEEYEEEPVGDGEEGEVNSEGEEEVEGGRGEYFCR